jgi:hypothetical protein
VDKADYIFTGGIILLVSLLFLAVSTYEIPFYGPEVNIQLVSAITTAIGIVLVGYGFAVKRN